MNKSIVLINVKKQYKTIRFNMNLSYRQYKDLIKFGKTITVYIDDENLNYDLLGYVEVITRDATGNCIFEIVDFNIEYVELLLTDRITFHIKPEDIGFMYGKFIPKSEIIKQKIDSLLYDI